MKIRFSDFGLKELGSKLRIVVAMALVVMAYPVMAASVKTAMDFFNDGQKEQLVGDYYSAVEDYREALNLNPKYADAWYNLSLCTYYLDEYDLAYQYSLEAEKYSRDYAKIKNLQGMCHLALGRITDAEKIFNDILAKYPNDVDARFGQAEISLYKGSPTAAESKYLDALKRDSRNRKALLSLALVCAAQGKDTQANNYINQALSYHSGEAEVHYLAAYLAAKRGDLVEAERRARSAVQINGNMDKAYELLSQVLYSKGRYSEVLDICDFRIGRNRNNSLAWYLKGISQVQLGQNEKAITTFTTGLQINPHDEVMRFAMEQLIVDSVAIEDSRRTGWAQYHVDKASEYHRTYNGGAERTEYQQALLVDPLNIPARQSYADMLERDSLYELFLYQLQFIKDNETESSSSGVQVNEDSPTKKRTARQIKNDDKMEALESMMMDNLSKKWNVDPFYLDKSRWNIGIYFVKNPAQLIHCDLERVIATAAGDMFSGVAATAVEVKSESVSGYGQAYKLARAAGLDYFAVISVDETERAIKIEGDLYSGRTGTKTKSISIYRTGNDRVTNALRRFRSSILDILPIRGKILKYSAGQVLVDLGKSDGIVKGAEFDVVKAGSIYTNDTGPGIYYRDEDVVGTFVVEKTNEELCQGTYKKKGFYDTMSVGDEVVLVKLPDSGQSQSGNIASDSRPAADANGNPVTDAAEKTEKEKIKEDLRYQFTESSLLKMLRSII